MMNSPCCSLSRRHRSMISTLVASLKPKHLLSQSLLVGALAAAGIISGFVPSFAEHSRSLEFSTSASAQAVTADEIQKYARAVLAMEPARQTAYNEIKAALGGSANTPAIRCDEADSLNQLPRNVRPIAVKYCETSKKIVESQGIDIKRFNAITLSVRTDAALEKRIQAELLQLQKKSAQ